MLTFTYFSLCGFVYKCIGFKAPNTSWTLLYISAFKQNSGKSAFVYLVKKIQGLGSSGTFSQSAINVLKPEFSSLNNLQVFETTAFFYYISYKTSCGETPTELKNLFTTLVKRSFTQSSHHYNYSLLTFGSSEMVIKRKLFVVVDITV